MSLIVTPPINSTETFQVATPFSYSFTYPTVVQTVDNPVYYFGGNLFIGNNGSSNSTIIECLDYQNPVTGNGLTYTVSNMTPTTDVLQCVLPIPKENYTINGTSYVTFGGPDLLYLSSTLPDTSNSIPARYYATFAGVGKFAYGLDDSTDDSLQYIPLVGTPVTSFKIKLARPHNITAMIDCVITNNVMTVQKLYSQQSGGGQVTVGMTYTNQGSPSRSFRVTSYITGVDGVFGGLGTYGVTPTDGLGTITGFTGGMIYIDYVAGSGDVLLSASMTPSSGTARFDISTSFTSNVPPPEV